MISRAMLLISPRVRKLKSSSESDHCAAPNLATVSAQLFNIAGVRTRWRLDVP